jgi:hypothetical protein
MRAVRWLVRTVGTGLAVVLGFVLFGIVAFAAFKVVDWQEQLEGRPGLVTQPESAEESLKSSLKLIADYCQYGSVSQAQLEGCYFHVHIGEIEGRNTNAARWARGDLDECLADAGPFCGTGYRQTLEERIDKKKLSAKQLTELEEKYGDTGG